MQKIPDISYEEIIEKIIDKAKDENITSIRANIQGRKKPDLINGYMPDIVVWHSYWMYIYVVITEETINNPEKETHLSVFSKYAKENFEKLIVLTPKGSKDKTYQKLREICADDYTLVEID